MKANSCLTIFHLVFASFPCAALQITLGGKTISYNGKTGVLRIQLEEPLRDDANLIVPPLGTCPADNVLRSIEVRDTTIEGKGFGAFATRSIEQNTFIGLYEGQIIKSRESLDTIVAKRATINAMDYVMNLDGGVTFIDGFERARDRSSFSTTHLNHADKGSERCNVIRLLEEDRVAFFTSRNVMTGEELAFNYGSNFWKGQENKKV